MQIDWFTFVAQIVNFLILVWLLKRFLYHPILNVMADRERRLAERAESAEAQTAAAADRQRQYEAKLMDLDAQRDTLRERARVEVETERAESIDQTRQEVAEIRAAWLRALEQEKVQHGEELSRKLAAGLCDTARTALAELADASLEDKIVDSFLRRIDALCEADAARLAGAAAPLHVKTVFELTTDQRRDIETRLGSAVGKAVAVQFSHDRDMVCGISLDTPEISIEWSVSEYCRQLASVTGLTPASGADLGAAD